MIAEQREKSSRRNVAKPSDQALQTRLRTYLLRHAQVFFGSLGRLSKTPLSTLMTAAVIGIALALPTGLHVVLKNVQQLSGGWNGATQISLFLKTNTSEARAQEIVGRLRAMSEINKVDYISRDQALAEFTRLSGFGDALKALDENPLPSVIVVTPALLHSSPEAAEKLLGRFKLFGEVDLAQLDMQWIQRLYAIMDIVQRGIQIIALLLALGVILVIGNTIRLAIQNRRDEIVVVKLIGGTDAFIRRPFLYSGFWYGLFGGVIALFFVILAVNALSAPVEKLAVLYHSQFTLTSLHFREVVLLGGTSIGLGLLGSWLAVGRHLKDIEPA